MRLGGPKQRALLALLLLHANEVVSADRLLEELWGGSAPDEQALHAHVSRLRKALEPYGGRELLVTRPPGYEMRLPAGRLDLLRFEALVDQARRDLGDGRAQQASERLREALGLWRGRPLADLENEPMHRLAGDRLDGIWLEALELRVEADLGSGRHAALVNELRALVRAHPYREGLRAQLMLALYRSDRQAEALEVFSDGHRVLSDDLGLEPSPRLRRLQAQILAQDPALDVARRTPPASPRRRRVAPIALAALAAALVTGALVLALGREDGPEPAADRGNVAVIDAATGEVRGRATAGTTPAAVALGEGAAWILDADAQTITRVDADTRETSTFGTGATPVDIAVGAGRVWIGNGRPVREAQVAGPVMTSVVGIDPSTRTVRTRVRLPRGGSQVTVDRDGAIAAEADAVWAVTPDGAVARIDPATGRVVAVVRGVTAKAVAAGPDGVWLLEEDNTVARIDRARNAVAERARIPASATSALAVGGGAAWVAAPGDGTLWRVEPGGRLLLRTIAVGAGASDVTFADGRIWVANPLRGTVTSVDPADDSVGSAVVTGGTPRAVAAAGGAVWVAAAGETDAAVAGEPTLPRSVCGPLLSAGGAEDLVIVSDLPLQGGLSFSTQQMEQAIAFTLRQRGFRAGRFAVGYQSCDHSVARTGLFDEDKCASNARRFANAEPVVAVIAHVNSACALAALPELNRAGLATVSPLASYAGLTRRAVGAPAGELERLRPSGRPTFARVYPPDDRQAQALAEVAADLGARSVAAVDDGDPPYGALLAASFARRARQLGLRVVRARFAPDAAGFGAVARRIARAQPDAVFVGGFLNGGGPELLRSLRDATGPDVDLLLPDGFTPTDLLRDQAGAAAEGAYVAVNGLIPDTVGPGGRRFAAAFGATQAGMPVEPSAVYAAQAAEVALDAVARSDGSRASVVREVFRTRLEDSLVGDVAFDAQGDPVASAVTVLRMRGGADDLDGFPGAVVDRVVRAAGASPKP